MDEGMKLFYRVQGLDVGTCSAIVRPEQWRVLPHTPVPDFVKEHAHVIAVDAFSTKDIAEAAAKLLPGTEQFKEHYIGLITIHRIIRQGEQAVEYMHTSQVRNPFPSFISIERILLNPAEAYEHALNTMRVHLGWPADFYTPPKEEVRSHLFFTPQFMKEYVRQA